MPRRPSVQHQNPASVELEDGRRIDLQEVIGAGAASTVYRAAMESPYGLRRIVAAKVFGAVASDDAELVASAIARAAQRCATVRHPNVVDVYDFFVRSGRPVLITELVEGVSLKALIDRHNERRRRPPLDLALFIAMEAAEALSGARTATDDDGMQLGLVHLGLTPSEVLLSWRGEVKVEGFGLNTARAGTSSVRSLRAMAGHATTMAPEVASGHPGDARSDVFALGMIMRELLVGPRFPRGIDNAQALRLAREGYLQPLCLQPKLPEAVVHVMSRAIAVDPDERYPNATAMAFELRRVALSLGVADGRYFLRRALDHELRDGVSDVTMELPGASGAFACEAEAEDPPPPTRRL